MLTDVRVDALLRVVETKVEEGVPSIAFEP